jgi:hypothetical protein
MIRHAFSRLIALASFGAGAVGVVLMSPTSPGASAQAAGQAPPQPPRATLVGWAMMPANTFSDGPTSGQFAGAGQFGNTLPVRDRQVVQGFSAVIAGPVAGTYYTVTDNGFGAKSNSADALLRVYAVRPDFRTPAGGSGTVSAANFRTGTRLDRFSPDSYITLRDPDRKLGFGLIADAATYTSANGSPAVAAEIKAGRLLTGADVDVESVRVDPSGAWWFGDEFGPFLIKTDRSGVVTRREIGLDGVTAPDNPYRGATPNTVGASKGFEGLAINPAGTKLFALVEGTVDGDPPGVLRINELDIASERFTGRIARYRLDVLGTNIGDMTALDDHTFLVIERNGASGTTGALAPFKKIFRVDIDVVDTDGTARKTEIVDLMNLADPNDLNRDGQATFNFPFNTIEDVLVVDASTLLVINDNNYPAGGGRGPVSDNTEMILIRLNTPLR